MIGIKDLNDHYKTSIVYRDIEFEVQFVIEEGVYIGWVCHFDGIISQSNSLEDLQNDLKTLLEVTVQCETKELLK